MCVFCAITALRAVRHAHFISACLGMFGQYMATLCAEERRQEMTAAPPHFSTNLSGEWGETDCMGNVRLHNDRFSLIKRLEANSKKRSEPCAHRPFWQFVLKPFL